MTGPDAVAALRDDQSARWRRGDRVSAEDYLTRHPDLSDEDKLVLVAGELALRWELGEEPAADEYAGRFPAFADDLRLQFGLRSLVVGSTASQPPVGDPGRPAVPGYDLHEEIGRGASGVVVRATHRRLNRAVAVKLIPGADPSRTVRSLDEARVMARLDHPHVLRVYEVGATATGLFLALELADGGSLADRLLAGPLPPREAADLLAGIAAATAAAHARGVVHRDIKPSNVLLCGVVPKLADFGLAKQLDLGVGVTATGQVVGTPQYMAPEQAAGGAVGPAADVYALGAVLYECLTGRPPLLAASPLALLRMVQEQEPVSPRALDPAVPRDLATVALKCLEKEPGRRYATAAELALDLQRYLRGEPVLARPVSAVGRGWRWAKRHPRESVLGGVTAALLLTLVGGSVAAAALLRRERDDARAAEKREELARLDAERLLAAQTRDAGRLGQRAAGLAAVRRRWEATPPALRTPELTLALRSEAAAGLTAADFAPTRTWPVGQVARFGSDAPPADLDRYTYTDADGRTVVAGDPPVRFGDPVENYRLRQFSPDGRVLVEGEFRIARPQDARLRGWDWAAGRRLFDRPVPMTDLRVAFHPAGRQLFVHDSLANVVRVLDRDTGAELRRSPPRFRATALTLHPDGRRLAVADYGRPVTVVDATDWREVARAPAADVVALDWSPDGRFLAAATVAGDLHLWEPATGRGRAVPAGLRAGPVAIGFAGPGLVLATSGDGATQLWAVPGLRPVARLPGRLVRAAPDGRAVLTADDRQATRFDRLPADEYRRVEISATAAVPSPDGRLVAVNDTDGPTLLDAATLAPVARLGLDECGPVAFDPAGGRLATFGRFSKVLVWPLTRDRIGPPAVAGLPPPRTRFGLSPQHAGRSAAWVAGRLLAGDHRDQRIAWLDPAGGPAAVIGPSPAPTAVAAAPDGRWLAAASDIHARLEVWDAAGRKALDRFGFLAVAFAPDGGWLAAAGRPGVCVYRAGEWSAPVWEVGPDAGTEGAATAVAVRPDGRVLAAPVAADRVGLFDAATGRRLLDLPADGPGVVSGLAFASDGGRLYVTRKHEAVGVWSLRAVAARLAELGLADPLDELPPAAAADPVGPLAVDRTPPGGGAWPADYWAQQWVHLAVGEVLKGDRWADAVDNMTKGLAVWPAGDATGRAGALDLRGKYHRRNGLTAAAADDWREAVRLDPTRADTAVRLAGLLLDQGDRPGAAAALAGVPADKRDAAWRAAMDRAAGGR